MIQPLTVAFVLVLAAAEATAAPACCRSMPVLPGALPHLSARASLPAALQASLAASLAAATQSSDEAYGILKATYEEARKNYDRLRVDAGKGKGEVPAKHPAEEFYWRFELLAKEGVSPARAWMLQNLGHAFPKKEDRPERAAALAEELITKSADDPCMLDAIAGIQNVSADVGKEKAIGWLQRIVESTHEPEVAARACMCHASLLTDGGKLTLKELVDEARELHRLVVATYPKTAAAKEASGMLLPAVQAAFLEAETAWVESVRELQRKGRPATDWPPQPVARFTIEYLPLAEAGHSDAAKWVHTLAPGFEQAQKQGPGIALSWLVEQLGVFYPRAVPEWARVRMGILAILYQQFPGEKWVLGSVRSLMSEVENLPPRCGIEPMRALLAATKDEPVAEGVTSEKNAYNEKLRAVATYVMAQTCRAAGDQRNYEEALGYYQAVLDKHPGEDVARLARAQADALRAVMPGSRAPEISGNMLRDEEGQPFRSQGYLGRVVMLEFWSFLDDRCTSVLPERIALAERMKDKPYSMLGVCLDRTTPAMYKDYAKKNGVTWRSCLLGNSQNAITDEWQVRCRPTTLLIDHEGIIRARNLPWAEMEKLAGELVAKAAEAKPAAIKPGEKPR